MESEFHASVFSILWECIFTFSYTIDNKNFTKTPYRAYFPGGLLYFFCNFSPLSTHPVSKEIATCPAPVLLFASLPSGSLILPFQEVKNNLTHPIRKTNHSFKINNYRLNLSSYIYLSLFDI